MLNVISSLFKKHYFLTQKLNFIDDQIPSLLSVPLSHFSFSLDLEFFQAFF